MSDVGSAPVPVPARLRVPALGRPAVSRSELIARLTHSGRPLVVVTAPAGYGKTTLLVEWVGLDERDVVWVSLDAGDDDPVVLLNDLSAALVSQGLADAAVVDDLERSVHGAGPSLVTRLGRVLAEATRSFLIVLDDVHLVTSMDGVGLIEGLADHVPGGSQLVVAGRGQHPFVARRRVSGEIAEVGPEDLALDDVGVLRTFDAEGLIISRDRAHQIVRRTEGWPAGVYLSALLAGQGGHEPDAASDIDGSSPFVADYLLHEVFAHLAHEVQEFLLDAAVLDAMNGSACDYVLEIDHSGRLLHQLQRSNLFVAHLDDGHDWYRFHSVFREFLLDERGHRRAAEHAPALLRRAATWCESKGLTDQAVEYLLRAGDVDRLAPLLARVAQPAFDDGRAATVERWFRDVDGRVIEQYPPLAVLQGWLAAVAGRPIEVERMAERVRALTFEGPTDDGWASFGAARSAFHAFVCADGVGAMNADAEMALEGAPVWSPWRSTALLLLGQARELAGDRRAASELFDESERVDLDAGRAPQLMTTVAQALCAAGEEDWTTAADRLDVALRRSQVIVPSNHLGGVLAHAAAARLALHRHDLVRVSEHLEVAMAARGLATYAVPHAAVRLRATLAAVYAAVGERSPAAMLLREIDGIVAKRPDLGTLLDEVARVRQLLAPGMSGASDLTAAELRVLQHLPTHLTFAEIGCELFVSRHTVHSHATAIYRKFGVTSRSEAVVRARQFGLT